ncbi:MAG: sensor histidine kinase [Burkholderiaceae bacterium]
MALALGMGVLAYYRRVDRTYSALAAAAAAYSVHMFSVGVLEPPTADATWDAWLAMTAWFSAGTVVWLVTRLTSAPSPRTGVAVALLAVPAAIAAAWEPRGWMAEWALLGATAAVGGAGLWLAAAGVKRRGAAIAGGGALLAAAAMLDVVRLPLDAEALPVLPWAHAALAAVAGWLLLGRFVETLNAAELLNVDLERLVRERTDQLQAQYERMRELERREAIAAERERLMRDMHDGVGGHLVSLLAMIEADRRRPGELAVIVRQALDDLRLMIDSLDPVDDDLNAVLAMFRDRLVPRLQRANVELRWDVEPLPAVPGLTPARVLHLLRLLQEVVSNALRHGRARTLTIGARAQAGRVVVEVRDDGIGFDTRNAGSGRGLNNLRWRATAVGAELSIDSAPGQGTTVTVMLLQ